MNDENLKLLKGIGNRIRKLRLDKGLTQMQLASDVNKDRQSIQRLESGNYNPSIIYLNEVCEGLEITVEEFSIN